MVFIKTQPEEIINIVKPVIQRNVFLADPGVILCSMMESQTVSIRQKAMGIIKKLKSKPPKKPRAKFLRGIRSIKPLALQWDAFLWFDIINWNSSNIHLPYIIEYLTYGEINLTLFEPRVFPPFPLHTQSGCHKCLVGLPTLAFPSLWPHKLYFKMFDKKQFLLNILKKN